MSLEEALAEQRELNSKLTLLGLPSSVRVDASRRCAREWSRLSWSERLKLCSRGRDTAPTAEESRVVISEVPRRTGSADRVTRDEWDGAFLIDALFAQLGQESQSKLLTIDQLSDSLRMCVPTTCDEVTQVFDGHQYITRRKRAPAVLRDDDVALLREILLGGARPLLVHDVHSLQDLLAHANVALGADWPVGEARWESIACTLRSESEFKQRLSGLAIDVPLHTMDELRMVCLQNTSLLATKPLDAADLLAAVQTAA